MAASHIRQTAVWALLGFCLLAHVQDAQGQPKPPDLNKPCIPFNDTNTLGYLTVTNKCPHDTFKVAMLRMDPAGKAPIYAMGADASGVPGSTPFQWLGPFLQFSMSTSVPDRPVWVAVVRKSDGKLVAPKGVKSDGSLVDVSSSRKRVCQLFVKGSKDFAMFRASLSPDGSKVIRNDFAFGERPNYPPLKGGEQGTPCEQYYEKATSTRPVLPAVEGRMVDVYDTGSCRVIIDDCSK